MPEAEKDSERQKWRDLETGEAKMENPGDTETRVANMERFGEVKMRNLGHGTTKIMRPMEPNPRKGPAHLHFLKVRP